MIRHIAIFTFKDGTDLSQITAAIDLIRERVPGALRSAYGRDAGLRAGNGEIGVSFDFPDEAAYRTWDAHPEHERIRKELIAPHLKSAARSQFRIDDR